jgi:plasmid stabilization system protein ParE
LKRYEIILLQGAQCDLLTIYTLRGERMYLQVDKALDVLRVFPKAGPVNFAGRVRRLVVSRTPLGIFYSVNGNRVLVGAVLDLRQAPDTIEKRLSEL